ncbi:zinc finger protein 776-like isoform X2 [Pleurodeles waltl]|uniref:zinc finger protein 776-like isoform X2 n=1 Tax=Pleurodeles waltl TaxID=8319 RepID=UPI003709C00E
MRQQRGMLKDQAKSTVFRKPSAIFKMDSKESSYSSGSSVTPSSSAPAEQPVTGKEKDPNNWGNCQQSLSYHGNLLKKLRLPTEDKPYSCKKCERSFSQKEHLAFHTRIHEGSRHYSCSECEKNLSGKTSVYSL